MLRCEKAGAAARLCALGDEKALADGGAQQVFGHIRFGIGGGLGHKHMAQRGRVHDHMPAAPHFAADHRLGGGDFGDDQKDVFARRIDGLQNAHGLGHQRHFDRQARRRRIGRGG